MCTHQYLSIKIEKQNYVSHKHPSYYIYKLKANLKLTCIIFNIKELT